jgi:hypothetical protein
VIRHVDDPPAVSLGGAGRARWVVLQKVLKHAKPLPLHRFLVQCERIAMRSRGLKSGFWYPQHTAFSIQSHARLLA